LYSNVLTGPTDGVLSLQADGSFNYVPAADFNGADTFSYQVTDSSGGFDTAQVVITITPVNDAPVITSAAYDTATEKISYQYLVTVAQPADEAPATVTILNYPGWCAASNDTLAGTAPLGSHGDTSFMVIVDDGEFADTLLVQLAIQDSDGYVPVTLSSFTAQALGAGVTLQWTTVSEHSNLGWNVMRSNSQNGPYQTINSALIAGAGTTVQPQQYAFDDGNVPTGTWDYLLEQVDLNGQKTYSAPVAVQVISTGISIRPEVAPESLRPGMELFNVHGQRQIYSESLQGVYFIKQGQGYLKILLVR
jgi:VCBS repeat-containing protein